MRAFPFVFVAVLLASAGVSYWVQSRPAPAAPTTGALVGRVLPPGPAAISLARGGRVEAGPDGRFALDGLPAGLQELEVRHRGKREVYGVEVVAGRTTTVAVPLAPQVADEVLRQELTIGGPPDWPPFNGRAVDAAGAAIARATVRVDGRLAATTNDAGGFTLTGDPGTVTVEAPGHEPAVGASIEGFAPGGPIVRTAPFVLPDALPARVLVARRPADLAADLGPLAAIPGNAGIQPRECFGPGDAPPPGIVAVTDLAAPTLGLAPDAKGTWHLQWAPVAQDPAPADVAAQYMDVRYDVQFRRPGGGTWCALRSLEGTAIAPDRTWAGHTYRVAAYARRADGLVMGPWSYFVVP